MQFSQPGFMGRRGLQPHRPPAALHSPTCSTRCCRPKAAMSALQGWAEQHPCCYRWLFTCPAAEHPATGVKILNSQVNDTSRIGLSLLGSPLPCVGCSPVGQWISSGCLWSHRAGNTTACQEISTGLFSGNGSLMRSAHQFMWRHRATSAFFWVLED